MQVIHMVQICKVLGGCFILAVLVTTSHKQCLPGVRLVAHWCL